MVLVLGHSSLTVASKWLVLVRRVRVLAPLSLVAVSVEHATVWGRFRHGKLLRWTYLPVSTFDPFDVLLFLYPFTGVEDGMTLRIPNAGDAPLSGKGSPGDLLVRVNVASSKVFRRQGSNLYHEARIPLHTALLGGRVRVPTLEGDVDVRVPGGTQHGEEMVLKDRGMSSLMGRSTGDLFVTFAVQLPR